MFNSSSLACTLLDSSNRTCWGLSGPQDPPIETCTTCDDEIRSLSAVDTILLQPNEYGTGYFQDQCNQTALWNLTAGDDGTEVWRRDNGCGGLALSDKFYKDVEFKGSFVHLDTDDDWIGFVFGYQDPGHFYLVLAPGDWGTQHAGKLMVLNKTY